MMEQSYGLCLCEFLSFSFCFKSSKRVGKNGNSFEVLFHQGE